MPPLRIAYDVSFLHSRLGRRNSTTGVGRVITNLLDELMLREDVDVRVVGSFAGDRNFIATSAHAERWASSQRDGSRLRSMPAIESRAGLGRWLSRIIAGMESRVPGSAVETVGGRTEGDRPVLRCLRKIASFDARPHLVSGAMDMFHATFMPPPACALSGSIPRVVTIHDVIPGRIPRECGEHAVGLFHRMVESLKPNRDVVVTNSEFTRRDFCAFTGFPEERTIAAPLAASSHFHPVTGARAMEELRERLGIGMRPYFLNVANPQPRKNMPHLVSSFYRFLAACPEWQGVLVLAGDSRSGWDTGALEEAIHSVPQFTDRVLRVGGVPEHDLPTLYSCALAFVFPSSYEGFGLPVLEAMACGAPVICADVTSLPEVAGDAALLVSPEDNSALSQAMQCLAKSESRRSELREKGFRQAGRFTWSGTAERVVEAYRLAHLQMSVPQGGACHLEALSV